MGKINVKLSNNYEATIEDAAQIYFNANRVKEFVIPDVVPGSWQIAKPNDLRHGFGAYAKLASPQDVGGVAQNYILLTVCFLKNQSIGISEIYNKSLDIQRDNGEISPEQRDLIKGGQVKTYDEYLAAPSVEKPILKERSLFLRPALLGVEKLNDLSQVDSFDFDWVYGNSMWTDQQNFIIDQTGSNSKIRTSKRTSNNYPDATMNEAGAYGDNPWPKDGMVSFFEADVSFTIDESEANDLAFKKIDECYNIQSEVWENQWNEINGPG